MEKYRVMGRDSPLFTTVWDVIRDSDGGTMSTHPSFEAALQARRLLHLKGLS